ncbi:sugar phosphate isomerase/epimerase [Kutzneria viridogrisea]|uniref:Xylose isomerase domain protein TIM barrel n=2 Tax=Kutzneria TaxID=43356 RepID=W5W5F9_9PSEU|nr:sugar phosphate isomerase/epimerase family protein [Kutzneria albida]AHH96473.1 Xylose isomerase domain protein TIM barrel [Kutzneria albida DSM 43870]MBA8928309.1 sugar phosphate isomerase/epimerase [Kutzneria viridogrisea]
MNRLSVNQQTIRQWSLAELVAGCSDAGVANVGLWREPVTEHGLARTARLVRSAGLSVTSLCRGGFFTAAEPAARTAALADNRAAIEQAAELGAPVLVLVSGGLADRPHDLAGARLRVAEALAELGPYAGERGVRLAVEPLHPMFCSDRCVVNTLRQARELVAPLPAEQVGVVVDTYHCWWDPQVYEEIALLGAAGRIALFQAADWVTPLPEGVLVGRGQLGDGHVPLRELLAATDAAGYRGPVEVEIFSEDLWRRPGGEVLRELLGRYRDHLLERPERDGTG